MLIDAKKLSINGSIATLAGHHATANSVDDVMWQKLKPLLEAMQFKPEPAETLAVTAGLKKAIVEEFLHRKAKSGEVFRVSSNRFYPRETFARLAAIAQSVAEASADQMFTAAQYRDQVGVNRMLSMDSVKMRLERDQELSFIEFNYMCLQAYDFVELNKRYGCVLQMGGSDQWGNIVTGIDLGRRMGTGQLYALTSPLLTTASGAKMGKTAAGAVWLNADMLSAWDYWQYWRNTEDADVGRFLKLFTELPLDEIRRLEALQGAEINDAKKILANEATAMAHGRAAADQAMETARKTFEEGGVSTDLPTIEIPRAEFNAGVGVLTAFVRAGLVATTGEARRQVKSGGLRVNDAAVSDERATLGERDLRDGAAKLSLGKKRHVLVRPV